MLHGNAGALREGCDFVADHDRKRTAHDASRLERVRQLSENAVELPDARLEVVDPRDAELLALLRQQLHQLPPNQEDIRTEGSDVLEGAVVEVKREPTQAALARANERPLAGAAAFEHQLPLHYGAHRGGRLGEVDGDDPTVLDS